MSPRTVFAMILLLTLTAGGQAEEWFLDRGERLRVMAEMAPSDSLFFGALDVSHLGSDRQLQRILREGRQRLGLGDWKRPAEHLTGRAFVAVFERAQPTRPDFVLGFELHQRETGLEAFREWSGLSASHGEMRSLGQHRFRFGPNGGYGLVQNFLLLTNSEKALAEVLEEGQSLAGEGSFRDAFGALSLEQGAVIFVPFKPLQELNGEAALEAFRFFVAGLDVSGGSLDSEAVLRMAPDTELGQAFLAPGGRLTGRGARFIPVDWGFLASFDLNYGRLALERLSSLYPGLRVLDPALQSKIGLSLQELGELCQGEVVLSSNGLKLLPELLSGHHQAGRRPPYRIFVSLALADVTRARELVALAFRRLSYEPLEVDEVWGIDQLELAYHFREQEQLLLLCYGAQARQSLRTSLDLKPEESLQEKVASSQLFPVDKAVCAGMVDASAVFERLAHWTPFQLVEGMQPQDGSSAATWRLMVGQRSLRWESRSPLPLAVGAGMGAILYLGARSGQEGGHD